MNISILDWLSGSEADWCHNGLLQSGKAGKRGATQLEKSERETKNAAQSRAKSLRGPTSKELLVQACVQTEEDKIWCPQVVVHCERKFSPIQVLQLWGERPPPWKCYSSEERSFPYVSGPSLRGNWRKPWCHPWERHLNVLQMELLRWQGPLESPIHLARTCGNNTADPWVDPWELMVFRPLYILLCLFLWWLLVLLC